jgi:hypothetical protein
MGLAPMVLALNVSIADELFVARLRWDLAPLSCERLLSLLPYRGEVVHARWSGEAVWSPLGPAWPQEEFLVEENATQCPKPGEILLYAGELSEPELLIPYGACRFASKAGPLRGNPVLLIEERTAELAALGVDVLRRGALKLNISRST